MGHFPKGRSSSASLKGNTSGGWSGTCKSRSSPSTGGSNPTALRVGASGVSGRQWVERPWRRCGSTADTGRGGSGHAAPTARRLQRDSWYRHRYRRRVRWHRCDLRPHELRNWSQQRPVKAVARSFPCRRGRHPQRSDPPCRDVTHRVFAWFRNPTGFFLRRRFTLVGTCIMEPGPRSPLQMPSFLQGSFLSNVFCARPWKEGGGCGEQYCKEGSFSSARELGTVHPGEVVIAHEVVDFWRDNSAWWFFSRCPAS